MLRRIVEAAADLTEARYAALGVIDATGRSLDPFITHGIDEETERPSASGRTAAASSVC